MKLVKLLIVDDEVDYADFIAEVSKDMGFEVLSVHNSSDFPVFYSTEINIFVLDLFMPGMDGIELLRFLYDNKSTASVVLISGKDLNVLHAAEKVALEQGTEILGILQKPFRAEELEKLLTKYTQRSMPIHQMALKMPSIDELRWALENNDLYLSYQPQINLSSREVIGVEALIRWNHPTKGKIQPHYFITLAEDNDLINKITSFATKSAIRQLGIWRKNGLDLRMSINYSPKVLDDLDMPEKLLACASRMGVDISKITIEITETALMIDVPRYMDILARLRMKGFNLAIDDFGIGHSSLLQLVRGPFRELKIDKMFVRKMEKNKECRTIVEISILLAHKLGMHVVAEGIEDKTTCNMLRDLNCDIGQGFWFHKPMRAHRIESWIKEWAKA